MSFYIFDLLIKGFNYMNKIYKINIYINKMFIMNLIMSDTNILYRERNLIKYLLKRFYINVYIILLEKIITKYIIFFLIENVLSFIPSRFPFSIRVYLII